jgi:Ca-activated chloride channel family protein
MSHDDPNLTAYALGDVDHLTPGQRDAIERQLAADPALAAEVERIRAAAAALSAGFADERSGIDPGGFAAAGVSGRAADRTTERFMSIGPSESSASNVSHTPNPRRGRTWGWALAAAACLVIGFGGGVVAERLRTPAAPSPVAIAGPEIGVPSTRPVVGVPATQPAIGVVSGTAPGPSLTPPPADPQAGKMKVAQQQMQMQQQGQQMQQMAQQVAQSTPTPALLPSARPAVNPMFAGGRPARSGGEPLRDQRIHAFRSREEFAGNRLAADGRAFRFEEGRMKVEGLAAPAEGKGKQVVDQLRANEEAGPGGFNTEAYDRIVDNPFLAVGQNPLSTFSVDVDTASYSNVRRFLRSNQLPPPDAVRIEELINYFEYNDPLPKGDEPFSTTIEVAAAPWEPSHRLVRIGIQGKVIRNENRPPSNLVFLIDTSGSMNQPNKLPLVQYGLKRLVDELRDNDTVSIVVYAGSAGLVLPPTKGSDKAQIHSALDQLQAGGSTNGGQGIELAYQQASEHFIKDGTNRVILCTDGDFNVGVTDRGSLTRLIEDKAKTGVYLTLLGFGMGNVKDATMEELSRKGNGNYAYIDTDREAAKVLVEQISSTLVTIAKDVKLQVEFNPAMVSAYRLIGYENRILAAEDFNDDTKDAGDIGAGHNVVAIYEVVPAGQKKPTDTPDVDPLRYQAPAAPVPADGRQNELLTLKLRYKAPDAQAVQGTSKLIQTHATDNPKAIEQASENLRWAAAVAAYGMTLRNSPYRGTADLNLAEKLATTAVGQDPGGYRREFIDLIAKTKELAKPQEK